MNRNALDAAQALAALVHELRGDTETDRRIAAPIVEELIAERLCRLAVVPELGGRGLSTVEALDVYEALAGQEASVGWVAWNNSLPSLFSRFLSPSARTELFADPTWLYASSTRPSGRAVVRGDGFQIDGRWALVSGCELAEWVALMCTIEEDGKIRMVAPDTPDMRLLFVRRGDFEILDTWHVGGLRGTGSHDVVVRGLFVQGEYSLSPGDASTLDHPLGRVPILCTLSAGFAAQVLGLAQAALDAVVELAQESVTPGPAPDLRDRPSAQGLVGSLSGALAAARSHLHACTGQLWQKAAEGGDATPEDCGAAIAAAAHAITVARETIDAMYATAGTSALYVESPLERIHRDAHAMFRHIIAQPIWVEQAGRVKFGMAPSEFLFTV